MKFSEEKKNSILSYILEQIAGGVADVSKTVSEKCQISRNTVNEYLKELADGQRIRKIKRNEYELVSETASYCLCRSEGEIKSETSIYVKCLEHHLENCTKQAKRIWDYGFSEMVNNVIDHSEAEKLEITVVKNCINTTVVLSDNGVGIFKKIKEHFALESIEEACCELFKGRLTTDDKNHSGEGIFFTSRMMDLFFIISDGKVFSIDKYDRDLTMDFELPEQVGTTVFMRLSNNSHREIASVFNQYAGVDDGFTKTEIPMKNIFDSAPVSRSQAKRICNRLEKFKEVVLDFSEIEWMGQAFAHQIFFVFQNEHPEIKFIPVNMSEDVAAIYNHVVNTR